MDRQAEAVMDRNAEHGEDDILAQWPYKVEQDNDIWRISGTLKKGHFRFYF